MHYAVIALRHISAEELEAFSGLEDRLMNGAGSDAFTLQPVAHYGMFYALRAYGATPSKGSFFKTAAVEAHRIAGAFGTPFDPVQPVPEGGVIAGSAQFLPSFHDRSSAHLFAFYVDEPYRQGGAASLFLAAVERDLVSLYGVSRFDLTVSPVNARAVRFYEKNGYRVTADAADFYGRGERRLVMAREVAGRP